MSLRLNQILGGADIRSPIFYDSDNISYYLDPNSASNLNNVTVAGTLTLSNIAKNSTAPIVINSGLSSSLGLRVYYDMNLYNTLTFTDGAWNSQGSIFGSSSVVTINAATATTSFVKYAGYSQEGGSFRAPIFYDSDNTAYYINPASNSIVNSLTFDSNITIYKHNDRNLLIQGGGGTDAGLLGRGSSGQFAFQVYGSGSGSYGFLDGAWAGWDIRKVVDGDLFLNDNNTYYLNPGSTTNLNNLTVAGTMTFGTLAYTTSSRRSKNSSNVNVETVTGLVSPTGPTFLEIRGFCPTTMYRTTGDRPAPYGLGFGNGSESGGIMPIGAGDNLQEIMLYGANSGPTTFTFKRQIWEGTAQDPDGSNYYGGAVFSINTGTGAVTASTDIRSPIFYDSNNTAYYCDPSSTSNLVGLTVANTITGSVSGNAATATNVTWTGITQSTRTNYDLTFQPPSSGYAGFSFNTTGGVAGSGGYFLIRGTSDTDVYTAEGITLVADGGWLTLAQRTTASRGVRIMTGTTSSERLKITTAGDIQFVNGNSITYNGNVVLHAGNYNSYSPTLTGTGASGTWGINITGSSASCTGNAATATRTSSQSGYPHAGTGMFAFYNWGGTDGGTSAPSASTYTTGISVGSNPGDQAYGFQIANNMWNTGLWTRNYNSSFGAWIRLLDSSNYVGYSAFTSSLTSTVDARAPIFYDSNDTGYYIDAASTSSLNSLISTEVYARNWFRNNDSGEGIYNQATTQHFYSDDVSYWNVASSSGVQGIRFRTGGHGGTVRGYVYANDSNDVGLLNNGGNWRVRVVGGDYVLFDGSSVRAQIFYDSNDTNYYVNPASTSVLQSLTVTDANLELYKSQTVDMSNTTTYSTSNYYPVTISVPTEGCIIQIQNNLNSNVPSWATHGSGFTLNLKWRTNGSGWGTTQIRRIIDQYFEQFTNQTICGGITQMTNSSIEVVWLRGGGQYLFKFSRNLSATAQAVAYTINSQTVTPGSTAQNTIWNSTNGSAVLYNDTIYSTSNMYTPVLYDYNNSAYFVDPASTSNLVGLTVANTITGSVSGNAVTAGGLAVHTGTNNEANKIVRTDSNGYIQAGWINTISGDSGTTAIDRIYASSDAYIRYYTPANFRTVLDVPTRGGSGASGTWGISISGNAASATSATSATTATEIVLTGLNNGTVSINNPRTAVYRNENGLGAALAYAPVLHAGGGDTMWQIQGTYGSTGNGTFYFRQGYQGVFGNWLTMLSSANYNSYSPTLTGTGASGSWGISVTGSSASCTGNSATTTLATKATRANGNFYIDDNYGNTVVGLYSANRYQGVFAMGDSYKLAADGTTTGTLYGIAWSHPNAGGVAANLNTHGALILENGAFLAALSGSIRSRDDMRSPIFYDSDNTAYYLDAANTTTSLLVAGSIGIGTTSPATRLHVIGTAGAARNVQLAGTTGLGSVFQLNNAVTALSRPVITLRNTQAGDTSSINRGAGIQFDLGYGGNSLENVGTRVSSGYITLAQESNADWTVTADRHSYLSFATISAGTVAERMRISSVGNVTINGSVTASSFIGNITKTSTTQTITGNSALTIDVAAAYIHIITIVPSGGVFGISSVTYNNRKAGPEVDEIILVFKWPASGSGSYNISNTIGDIPFNYGKATVTRLTSYKGTGGVWIAQTMISNIDYTNL